MGLQERMGLLAPWDQWVLEDSPGGMDYPPQLAPYLHRVGGATGIQCKFDHHWDGKFPTLSWEVVKSCDAVPTERESKYGGTFKYDCEEPRTTRPSFGPVGRKYSPTGVR